MTMVTTSTALTIFIMNIHHCGPDAKPVPKWAKKVILQYMARMFFVYEVGENCMTPQPEKQESAPPRSTRNTHWAQNGQAGPCRDNPPLGTEGDQDAESSKGEEDTDQMSTLGSLGTSPTNRYTSWKNGVFQSMDCGGSPCTWTRCRKGGVSDGENHERGAACLEPQLLQNIEYIANCYREQRATQKRTGEWKRVAKVLDRCFMWIFFIMVFLMSLLIMGKVV